MSAKFDKDLNAGLTQEQRNIAHATISMLENHLIWILLYWRTKNPELLIKGYKVNLQHALGCQLPNSILNFFFRFTFGRKVNIHFDFIQWFCFWCVFLNLYIYSICIHQIFFFVKRQCQRNINFYCIYLITVSINKCHSSLCHCSQAKP